MRDQPCDRAARRRTGRRILAAIELHPCPEPGAARVICGRNAVEEPDTERIEALLRAPEIDLHRSERRDVADRHYAKRCTRRDHLRQRIVGEILAR